MMTTTAPANADAVGIYAKYCDPTRPSKFTLATSTKLLGGAELNMTSSEGGGGRSPFVFRCKRLGKCRIVSSEGQVLYTLRKSHASLFSNYYAKDEHDRDVIRIRSESMFKRDLSVTFCNSAAAAAAATAKNKDEVRLMLVRGEVSGTCAAEHAAWHNPSSNRVLMCLAAKEIEAVRAKARRKSVGNAAEEQQRSGL